MPALTLRAFRRSLAEHALAPAYLLHGDDDYRKDVAVRELVEAVVDPATRDFNLELRRAADLDAEAVGGLLGTPPLMAERRLVVLRDVAALRKEARRELDRYLAQPAPDVVVALVASAGDKADKALLGHASIAAVDFPSLSGDEVPRWIEHHVTTELGAAIAPGAAALLFAAVGADLAQLATELDKLTSYVGGGEIDEAAVGAIVGVRRGETMGDLLDAIGVRDAGRALDLLSHVLAQPKTSGVQLVMALSNQMLAIAWAQAARAEGLPISRLESEFFGFLKECGGYAGRAWGEAAKAWVRHVPHWSADDLDHALAALLAADMSLKDTRATSDEQVLTTMILALCARPATR